jgi:hypothetical protein
MSRDAMLVGVGQRTFNRSDPPSSWPVPDEGVLRRRICGAKVMQDQFLHLTDAGERASVKIHVIPAETGAHVGLLGALAIASFGEDGRDLILKVAGEYGRDVAEVQSQRRQLRRGRRAGGGGPGAGARHQGPRRSGAPVYARRVAAVR